MRAEVSPTGEVCAGTSMNGNDGGSTRFDQTSSTTQGRTLLKNQKTGPRSGSQHFDLRDKDRTGSGLISATDHERRNTMTLNIHTTEVMKLLPAALRPNPYNIEETVMNAVGAGWTTSDLVAAVMADKPREAGHVVAALRRVATTPPPTLGHSTMSGPCQLGCDHGWTESVSQPGAAVPCATCRPETLRRVRERAQLQTQGAPLWQQETAMRDGRPGPRTYPATATPPPHTSTPTHTPHPLGYAS